MGSNLLTSSVLHTLRDSNAVQPILYKLPVANMLYFDKSIYCLKCLMTVQNSEPYALKTICFSYLNVEYASVNLYSYVWGSPDVHLLMQTMLKLFVQRFDCLNLQTIHSFYFFHLLYIYEQSFNIFSHYYTHRVGACAVVNYKNMTHVRYM